jgi:23S rRNA pseudouridine1911/1915/1917 synthase
MKSSDKESVLYCDNHLLVAEKPPGMLTQPDDGGGMSLEEFAKSWVKEKYQKGGAVFLHAIHRLDKPVSGLVLFARTSKALSRLNEQSRVQEIQRIYVAEIEGVLGENEGQLDHFLIHGDHRAIIAKKGDPEAKHARLFYKTIKQKTHTTLLEIELETGRYHQIRAQFGAVGHPVVGDLRYGAKSGDGEAVRLHCAKLLFKHPVTQELLTFESAAPFD